MKVLGLIPARAGSERCPGKNVAELGGKALISWTVEAAKKSGVFDHLIISTNDQHAALIAVESGCTLLERPDRLAQSETPMLPVVRHALSAYEAEIIVLLQPTSPFRSVEDIQKSLSLLINSSGDAVVSVTEAPKDLVFELGHANRMRPNRTVVVPNGALYLITRSHLEAGGDWYNGITYAYVMPKDRSLDIDTKLDLEIARLMVRKGLAA